MNAKAKICSGRLISNPVLFIRGRCLQVSVGLSLCEFLLPGYLNTVVFYFFDFATNSVAQLFLLDLWTRVIFPDASQI